MKKVILIHQDSKIEENRRLIREIAKEVFDDPLQDIQDYEEWLENVINAPKEMKKKYDTKMKAKLILKFYKRKIKAKTGIFLNIIRWDKLPREDIILWTKNDKDRNLINLGKQRINEILGRIDQLNLSEEFLASIKRPQYFVSLESKIIKYFRDLFHREINWDKKIRWNKLTNADFVNWPEDIPVKSAANMALVERKKLNTVLESVKLSDHFMKTYQMRMGYSKRGKRVFISRHLLTLLEKFVGISYFQLPKIYPEEVIGWPAMNIVNPEKISVSDLDNVFQNLNYLYISDTCIERLKGSHKSKSVLLSNELRKHVVEMLSTISDKQSNIRVPWSKISRDSFTWWPSGIEFMDPTQLSADDLRMIIANKDKIKFTEKFKAEYLKYIEATV